MRPPRANPYRDAWAGELGAGRVGERVRVAGWVHRRRDHGGLVFIDLRDRSGIVQLVFHPESAAAAHALAQRLRPEHVLSAAGEIVRREPRNVNPNLETGEIEISVQDAEHLAEAATPPFAIDEDGPVDEMIRLRHRMLDLRRQGMRDAMVDAPHGQPGDPRLPQRERLPRDRDADPHALDARGRARLPRAVAPEPRRVLRAPAVAAAVQAAADDERLRALLPDRALLPRRGPARRPPARVHAARPRDELRRGGGRPRHDRGAARARVRGGRLRGAAGAVAAAGLRRGDAALRLRQAGHALRARDRRPRRGRSRRPSSASSRACWRAAASCAASTPARARPRAPSSTS